ncbi:Fibrocystin-L [Trichinella pseudospiralis]
MQNKDPTPYLFHSILLLNVIKISENFSTKTLQQLHLFLACSWPSLVHLPSRQLIMIIIFMIPVLMFG